MKWRSIILRDYEVRAVLAGTKTQHRLVLKPQPDRRWRYFGNGWFCTGKHERHDVRIHCPFEVGMRLWVKEATHRRPMLSIFSGKPLDKKYDGGAYMADGEVVLNELEFDIAWWHPRNVCPAQNMPRWASRISLEVKRVWLERLQDISEDDVGKNGMACLTKDGGTTYKYGISGAGGWPGANGGGWRWQEWDRSPSKAFIKYWDQRHVKKPSCSWAANPWIGVAEFKRVTDK